MSIINEQDLVRLRKDKEFAKEALLNRSDELLKSSIELLAKKPEIKNEIINSIGYSIDTHLNTKDKLKVIHKLSKDVRSSSITGFRNIFALGTIKYNEFLAEFTSTLDWIEAKEEGKILEREDILKELLQKKDKIEENNTDRGFLSKLNENQIQGLYDKLIKFKYIDKDTLSEDFEAIFKNELLPKKFTKVKWICLWRGKPNQTSLREFLKATMLLSSLEPSQVAIDACFTDSFRNKIVLGKNKTTASTNRWTKKFRSMVS